MLSQLASRIFGWPPLVTLSSSLLLLGLQGLFAGTPSFAAERVLLKYGPLEESLTVQDLRIYAQTHQASPELAELLGLLNPETQEQIYEFFQVKKAIEPIQLEQLLALERGKAILADAAKVTQRDQPAGIQAMRIGLLQGSESKEGLSAVSFLEAYPEEDIPIDIVQARKFFRANQDLIAAERNMLKSTAPKQLTRPENLNGDRPWTNPLPR